ncbi:LysM peptidoglycan-binding domain-containing protein [Patescibacteria group bacterium]|nr:MAG: LysM peptidoglycan-binding domain-containing protein [Patescibacteria group bacterium]
MGWRKVISREVSGSLPAIGIGLSNIQDASKLKLPNTTQQNTQTIPVPAQGLTPVGQVVQKAGIVATHSAFPRFATHLAAVALVGAVVLAGSTTHSARLNPLANQVGFGSTIDKAAEMEVAAAVASQTDLLVESDISSNAKTLNSQVGLPTSGDATLAQRQVVDTSGSSARGVTSYTVQQGDTLASVAANFNITTDTIRWANGNMAPTAELKPGQNLVILPISGLQHQVKDGETAQSLADHYSSNAEQIIAFNNAEVDGLKPGQVIVVPDGVFPEAAPVARAAANTPAATPAPAESSAPAKVSLAPGSRNNTYSYGYCTWYVASKRAVPGGWGNARSWYANAQASGIGVGSAPRPGAIAWTGAGYYGHVAYVESVSGNMVTVSEMNYNGWNRVSSRTVPASTFRYIY